MMDESGKRGADERDVDEGGRGVGVADADVNGSEIEKKKQQNRSSDNDANSEKRKKYGRRRRREVDEEDDDSDDDNYVPYVPVKQRRQQKLEQVRKVTAEKELEEALNKMEDEDERARNTTLLEEHSDLVRKGLNVEESELDKQLKLEEEIMKAIRNAKALKSVSELAHGIRYTKPIKTSWRPPRFTEKRSMVLIDKVMSKYDIDVTGEDPPHPLLSFEEMKFPSPILKFLKKNKITTPSPIQLQGLPIALSGRDMIGVASTGSGKTLCFALPAILFCMEQETKLPFEKGEGPYALFLAPSRELAKQTFQVIKDIVQYIVDAGGVKLNTILLSGGFDTNEQLQAARGAVHIAVATPGKLIDSLKRGKINLQVCRYFCMDEADRMVDVGFEEDVRLIYSFFKGQRQTLLFSATMPRQIREFAESALVKHVVVNVGKAGEASKSIRQDVEYVRPEAKIVHLLDCLQKTAPPVIIFSEKKSDVDDIHEYLLLKGVRAVAIHGSKEQDERNMAIKGFKERRKDVLVATDIASKGLDIQGIKHVINFDMPSELENYVHRIGRTGRGGLMGVATTFVDDSVPQITLLDLKYLLKNANQHIPPFLDGVHGEDEKFLEYGGCAYCGGPGHRVTACPKLESLQNQQQSKLGKGDMLREGF
eukprot:m.29336 g.29336  ORF g.29336 m.29336 type:complete len:651 (+) comp9564_c0_seq1:72-2024(+)